MPHLISGNFLYRVRRATEVLEQEWHKLYEEEQAAVAARLTALIESSGELPPASIVKLSSIITKWGKRG